MKKMGQQRVRIFSILASILMVFSLLIPGFAVAESNVDQYQYLSDIKADTKVKVNDRLLEEFKKDEKVTFLIKFNEKVDTEKVVKDVKKTAKKANLTSYKTRFMQRSAVVSELKTTALEEQQDVLTYLEQEVENGNAEDIQSYFIVNGMAVTATKEVAERVASFSEVEKVLPNETRQLIVSKTEDAKAPKSDDENVEWNVERVGAPEAWERGIDGTGVVVASIDSGVQWDHPALKEKYRGYDAKTGEVSHDFNWFDATARKLVPYDDVDHGTHVTGTMVGGEPDGSNQIGVAPGAKWIAVKAFSRGGGTDADLLAAAEWILAPTDAEGNVDVDKAPDIVNNSWGGGAGLDEWYRDVVKSWRAAEIFPEFSAGNVTLYNNGGPGSVAAPANYPESFATGSTDINNKVADTSLRGPSPYKEIKPDISAPGVNIRSSVPGGGYEGGWDGTSMAGPAVSAVAAMLRQVDASMSVSDMEDLLIKTAIPLTDKENPESPNHGYGYGLVDAERAILSITEGLGTLEGQVIHKDDNSAVTGQVSILENGRSVNTNSEDGTFKLLHGIGEFTAKAEAYGYQSKEQLVTIEKDETTQADFTLEEAPRGTVNGVVTNKSTGDAIEGARLLLVEDANVAPVETNEDGGYDFTAYEGAYTLKIIAHNHHSKEVTVTINGDIKELNIELDPYYTYSGGEIGYDDGTPEIGIAPYEAGSGYGVKMSLPAGKDSAIVTSGVFHFRDKSFPNPGGTEFAVEVWDATGENGQPGEKIAGPIYAEAIRDGKTWTVVDLWEHNIIVTSDFYMVYIQANNVPYVPGMALDRDGPYSGRNYQYHAGLWEQTYADRGNYMIRARVAYELDTPKITTPKDELVTNEKNLAIEGTASPTTTVQLMNNGENKNEASIGDDGRFKIPGNLTEGENKLTVVSNFNGDLTAESDPITVTLDTVKPELKIDSPHSGEQTNKETVIVTGTASDNLELDWVKVNDQEVDLTNGKYSTRIILDEGENEIEVIAKDKAGNIETKTTTIKVVTTTPIIKNLIPSVDQYVFTGEKIEVSFESDVKGGEANFEVKTSSSNTTQSSTQNKMEEIKPGTYKGEWIVPAGLNFQGTVIEVELTDRAGNKVTEEAKGNLFINQERLDRLSGQSRYETAIEISKKGWTASDTVVISRGDEYADALAGVPLTYQLDAPILLTNNNKLNKETLMEIQRLGAKNAIILGGPKAISDSVVKELKKAGVTVERIAGKDRFDTAAKIATKIAPKGTSKIAVVNGMDFPDALSVASHAAKEGIPILLTQTNKLPKATKDAIENLKAKETIVIGGLKVVEEKVEKQLPAPKRLSGQDRYETNIEIAKHFGVDSKHMYVATGKDYADALTGAVLAAKNNSAIVLVHNRVPKGTSTYITDEHIKKLTIFGGPAAVNGNVENELHKLLK